MDESLVPKHLAADEFIKYVGVDVVRNEAGEVVAQLRIEPQHLNGVGVAQGGAIFTLADYAFAMASNSDGRISVGLNTTITYVEPARLGDLLTARVEEISRKRTISNYAIRIVNQEDKTIASFTGVAYKIGETETKKCNTSAV